MVQMLYMLIVSQLVSIVMAIQQQHCWYSIAGTALLT